MALSHLTDGVVTGASSSIVVTTASVSIPDGQMAIFSVAAARNSGTLPDYEWGAASGAGLTWTALTSLSWGSRRGSKIWYAKNTSGSTATGTLTVTISTSATAQEAMWSVDLESNPAASTLFGTAATNNGAATSGSVTVPGTPAAGDKVFAFFAHENASDTITLGSELDATLVQRGSGSNVRRILSAYDSAPDGTPVANASWSSSNNWGAIAVILKAGAGGGSLSQSIDVTLDSVAVAVTQTSSAPKSQAIAVTLDDVAVSISQTGAVPAQTGLLFALNGAVDSMARIEWPSHTDAMALRKSCTFIYEYETDASQVGYGAQVWFSTEGWTGDGPGWNAGFHSAYPCNLAYDSTGQATGGTGSSGTTHAPEIAGLGSHDYIHTPTGSSGTAAASYKGTRRRAAVVLEDVGSDIRHTFYYNLPSTTDKIVIDFDQATLDGYSVADALLRVGSSPWTDNTPFSGRNEETANGLLRFFKVFDVPLSESDMLTEAATESNTPATTAGLASVYYTNINPTVADISDKSGAGNDPAWANAQRPDDWSAPGLSQALAITLDDLSASVAQNLQHSQAIAATLDGVTVAIAQTKTGSRTQSIAFALDDVSAAVAQNLRHSQALAATLDSVQVDIVQGINGALSQSLAITLDDVSSAVAQNLRRAQSLAIVLDGVSVSVAQSVSSPAKTQALSAVLDDIDVFIDQQGRDPSPDVVLLGGGPGTPRKHKAIEKGSYLERLLSPPLADRLERIKPEAAEFIEEAAEDAIERPSAAPVAAQEFRRDMKNDGIAYRDAYREIYLQVFAEMRQAQEDEDEDAIALAMVL